MWYHQRSMRQLFVITFGCFSLSALSVYGRVLSDGLTYFDPVNFENEDSPSVMDTNLGRRIIRQSNRRPVTTRQQQPSTSNGNSDYEDIFGGLDPNPIGFNNQQFGQNQGQWSNNNGNQRPNQQQQQQQGFNNNNRPPNQNGQWFNNNGGNQGQGFPNNNGANQGQGFPNNNGGNQGQGFPNNGPTNQNQNQNQGQSANGSSENERTACNSRCKERVTNEYNPVCGSDAVTYQNRRFLECAADCGIRTELSYIGTCQRS